MTVPNPGETAPSTQREVELKLRVHALYQLPALTAETWGVAEVEQCPVRQLAAVYHDTPDLALIRWGVTLRRREGGPDAGWHLKLPVDGASGSDRDEIHLPLASGEVGEPPPVLLDLVTVLLRGARVLPLVTVRTQRQPYLLRNCDARPVIELVDDVVEIVHDGVTLERFREIEVEGIAMDGAVDRELMAEVVALLEGAGATRSSLSKAAGALGPAAAAPPDVPEPQWPDRRDPSGVMIQAVLASQVRRLLWQDIRWRRRLPDSVHQMRVACRRLRSALRSFEPLVDGIWAEALRADLAWLAGELAGARDREVMVARMTEHLRTLPPVHSERATAAIGPWLNRDEQEADLRIDDALRSSRYADLISTLVAAAVTPPLTEEASVPCRDALPPLIKVAMTRLARAFADVSVETPTSAWHDLRLLAKRSRYAADACAPILGRRFAELAATLEQLTELLGEHQDAEVCGALIDQLAQQPDLDPRSAYALGLMRAEESARQVRARSVALDVWRDVVKAARRADVLSSKAAARA